MTDFPVDVTFDVPEGWVPLAEEGADFVLLKNGDYPKFRPNITVQSAELAVDKTLTDLADHLFAQLEATSVTAKLAQREAHDADDSQTMFQGVEMQISFEGTPINLLHTTTLVELRDKFSDRHWANWASLTVLPEDARSVAADFQHFIASCKFSLPEAAGGEAN